MTVDEKRKILIEHCDKMHEGESGCDDCQLLGKCLKISDDIPALMSDTEITRLFSKFEKLKGGQNHGRKDHHHYSQRIQILNI